MDELHGLWIGHLPFHVLVLRSSYKLSTSDPHVLRTDPTGSCQYIYIARCETLQVNETLFWILEYMMNAHRPDRLTYVYGNT